MGPLEVISQKPELVDLCPDHLVRGPSPIKDPLFTRPLEGKKELHEE